MKKAILTGALIAATLAPMAAQAQDYHRDHDRREWREDRRNSRHDRREWRQDRREDWQRYREANRDRYRRGHWNAPFRYRSFDVGVVAPRSYWGSRYYVNDWSRYRLPAPSRGYYQYVRHYDDLLLVNTRNGRVVQVYRNFYW